MLSAPSYAGKIGTITLASVDLKINLMSKVPSYIQLYEQLKAAIESGELAVGDQIPSIRELIQATDLAMSTVQRAVRKLENEHYVFAVTGRGVFVTSRT